ncbi:PIN domain-containing protein [Patulibacter americanus]|uniref:PIN domain-containing protein n=1 Tax=Patulibacter americanus TaxID=588672 RepID=UPI0003B5DCAA|nr:PIN domain-containing protein [Patulibacter americanus]
MSGSLLDTSVLIAGTDAVGAVLPTSAAISVVTLGELHAGVRLARTPTAERMRRERLALVRGAFMALPVDDPTAEHYGEVLALARVQGRTAKATDLLIIATALATDRQLVTLDHAQGRLAEAAGVIVSGV